MSRLRKGRDAVSLGRLTRAVPDVGVALAYPDVNRSPLRPPTLLCFCTVELLKGQH